MIEIGNRVVCTNGKLGIVLAELENQLFKWVVKIDDQWYYFNDGEIRKVDVNE